MQFNPTSGKYEGLGTVYINGPVNSTDTKDMTCSFQYINTYFANHFVALNDQQWNTARNCGRCLSVSCIDPTCTTNSTELVMVVDNYPKGEQGDLDFVNSSFKTITGKSWDMKKISWKWASCASKVSGPIQLHPKDDSSRYWSAFYISNYKYRVAKVTLNGVALEQTTYNYWFTNTPMTKGPYTMVLYSVPIAGKVLRTSITTNNIYQFLTLPQFSTSVLAV